MIWHLHNFSRWEDVKLGDECKSVPMVAVVVVRQVITQQRRCAICNLVQTRYSA
jgi:hypothetical protein